jgi:hypothetical protein
MHGLWVFFFLAKEVEKEIAHVIRKGSEKLARNLTVREYSTSENNCSP